MDAIVIAALVVALAALAILLAISLARTKRSVRRFQLLNDIAEVSDGSGSLADTLNAISDVLVPDLADFCMIDVISEGRAERAAVRIGPGRGPEVAEALAAREPSIPAQMMEGSPTPSLELRFFERMSEANLREIAHDPHDLEFLRDLDVRSAITVALTARGMRTGALTLGVGWSGRRYSSDDARFARVLSGRVALALDNAGLFSDLERVEQARAEIAETLQRGLLPPPLPHIPGWSAAAMYQPAGAENEVGGDFYDVFPVSGGWMVVIGDVTGRGAEAASVTAQARYTLRTAAMLTGDPLIALATLNRALLARRDSALCGVVAFALSEDPTAPVKLAVAGHLPPLLVDGDSVTEVARPGSLLGAMPDAAWDLEQVSLAPGQQLVVVTDGIVEACGSSGRFGEERLHAELTGAGPAHAVPRLESALRAFTDGALDDDVAILAIAPTPGIPLMGMDSDEALVSRLFDAFNRRDDSEIAAVCDEEMEFFPVTGEAMGRTAPYAGHLGLRDYLEDIASFWEELLVTPKQIERRGERLLVQGRVYLRSRELGIRDMPVAWIWELRDHRFIRGEVFADSAQALRHFNAGETPPTDQVVMSNPADRVTRGVNRPAAP